MSLSFLSKLFCHAPLRPRGCSVKQPFTWPELMSRLGFIKLESGGQEEHNTQPLLFPEVTSPPSPSLAGFSSPITLKCTDHFAALADNSLADLQPRLVAAWPPLKWSYQQKTGCRTGGAQAGHGALTIPASPQGLKGVLGRGT